MRVLPGGGAQRRPARPGRPRWPAAPGRPGRAASRGRGGQRVGRRRPCLGPDGCPAGVQSAVVVVVATSRREDPPAPGTASTGQGHPRGSGPPVAEHDAAGRWSAPSRPAPGGAGRAPRRTAACRCRCTSGDTVSSSSSTRSWSSSVRTSSPLPSTVMVPPGCSLSAGDRAGHVVRDDLDRPPCGVPQGPRRDVLAGAVEVRGERVVGRCRRPERRHLLVGLAAEQVGVGRGHPLGPRLGHHVVEVGPLPAAVDEAALGVLLRVARAPASRRPGTGTRRRRGCGACGSSGAGSRHRGQTGAAAPGTHRPGRLSAVVTRE